MYFGVIGLTFCIFQIGANQELQIIWEYPLFFVLKEFVMHNNHPIGNNCQQT